MNNQQNNASGTETTEKPSDGNRKVQPLVLWIRYFPAMILLLMIIIVWTPLLMLRHVLEGVEECLMEARHWIKQIAVHPHYYDFFDKVEEANQRDRERALRELRK